MRNPLAARGALLVASSLIVATAVACSSQGGDGENGSPSTSGGANGTGSVPGSGSGATPGVGGSSGGTPGAGGATPGTGGSGAWTATGATGGTIDPALNECA